MWCIIMLDTFQSFEISLEAEDSERYLTLLLKMTESSNNFKAVNVVYDCR